ncbi:MAG: hypothetical protein L3K09_06265 [Thermoplasmata archaeon]|nr:hypothetical protein [Thermoplasmata archaeon]
MTSSPDRPGFPGLFAPTSLRRPRGLGRYLGWAITLLALSTLVIASWSAGRVILTYTANSRVASTGSPFHFVDGGDYAALHTQGYATLTYGSPQQLSATFATEAFDGASGSYLLDVVELQSLVTSGATWHIALRVLTPLAGTGINAAYVSYCTARPTTVPDTGASLASGTDVNGNPWALFAPTCAGPAIQVSLSLLAVAQGAFVNVVGVTNGVSVAFLSFLFAVTNTGASTTTSASLAVFATTP